MSLHKQVGGIIGVIPGGEVVGGLVGSLLGPLLSLFADANPTNLNTQMRRVYAAGGSAEFAARLFAATRTGDNKRGEKAKELLAKTQIVAGDVQRDRPAASWRDCAGFNLWTAVYNGVMGRRVQVLTRTKQRTGCGEEDDSTLKPEIKEALAPLGGIAVLAEINALVVDRDQAAYSLIAQVHTAIGVRAVDVSALTTTVPLDIDTVAIPGGISEEEAEQLVDAGNVSPPTADGPGDGGGWWPPDGLAIAATALAVVGGILVLFVVARR